MNNFLEQLKESILNPQAQKLVNSWSELHGDEGKRYHDSIFGDSDRIVIPLGNEKSHRPIDTTKIPESVSNTLTKHGYGIHDYVNNIAIRNRVDINGNLREEKPSISKILAREKDQKALKEFNEDPQRRSRNSQDHEIVISRSHQDLGRMTSSRRWCGGACTRLPGPEMKHPELASHVSDEDMAMGGVFHHKISDDIKHGTLIAHLVRKGDHNVEDPLGRILLKKHEAYDVNGNKIEGRHIWRPEFGHDFGHSPDNFKNTVEKWADTHYPALREGESSMEYRKHPDLYNDERNANGEELTSITKYRQGKHTIGNKQIFINSEGKLHDNSEKEPAVFIDNGLHSTIKEFYQNGVQHREGDKPQEIRTSLASSGKVVMTHAFRKHGYLHREGDKPALIQREHPEGNDFEFTHAKFGVIHRNPENGPAVFNHRHFQFMSNGVEHRPVSQGPSFADKYGNFSHKEYGNFKNPPTGGPASKESSIHFWASEGDKPEANYNSTSGNLTLTHSNGDVHRYNMTTGKKIVISNEGVSSSHMSEDDKNLVNHYSEKSKIVPEFKNYTKQD